MIHFCWDSLTAQFCILRSILEVNILAQYFFIASISHTSVWLSSRSKWNYFGAVFIPFIIRHDWNFSFIELYGYDIMIVCKTNIQIFSTMLKKLPSLHGDMCIKVFVSCLKDKCLNNLPKQWSLFVKMSVNILFFLFLRGT